MDPPAPPYPYPPPQPYQPPISGFSAVSAAPTVTHAAPTVTPAAEPQNNNNNNNNNSNINTHTHVGVVAANPTSNHPPYAEMIYAAITALKEKDGSSKRAIAKYIERVYSGLPATFSALLTHNLKRLKSSGHLVMVKKSYALPRSDNSLPPLPSAPADLADLSDPATATAALSSSAAAPSRGRGRPPKPKPDLSPPGFQQPISQRPIPIPFPQQPNLQQLIHIPQQPLLQQQQLMLQQQQQQLMLQQQQQQSMLQQQQPMLQQQQPMLQQQQPMLQQQQPMLQQQQPNFQAYQEPNSQPVLVAIGLADEPASAKRRPGRPRKVPGAGAVVQVGGGVVSAKRGRGRPPGSRLSKKRTGRPPKPKSVSSVVGPNGLVKRARGRPPSKAEPKSVFFPQVTNVPIMGAFEQNNVPNMVVVAAQQPPPLRRRGRPKRDAPAGAAGGANAGGLVSGKRRGRPPLVPGVERPKTKRKPGSGRPVGRPRKNASLAITEVPDPQSAANGEFKRKLEYVQFRVGQAVGALKPHLNHESAVNAVAAIQELEALASMDISAPLNIEPQQTPLLQS